MKIKTLVFLLPILINCRSEKPISTYAQNIGDIEFDPKTDNSNFKLCFDKYVFQYFNDSNGLQYEGEKVALDKTFFGNYIDQNLFGESGLIRIRFIVNCKGETDRYRILEMDENYNQKKFNENITTQLLQITKSLKGWKPKIIENENIDYYQYLIFKVKDGNLIEILP